MSWLGWLVDNISGVPGECSVTEDSLNWPEPPPCVGERWFFKVPTGITVFSGKVVDVTRKTIRIEYDNYSRTRYELGYLEFIERADDGL